MVELGWPRGVVLQRTKDRNLPTVMTTRRMRALGLGGLGLAEEGCFPLLEALEDPDLGRGVIAAGNQAGAEPVGIDRLPGDDEVAGLVHRHGGACLTADGLGVTSTASSSRPFSLLSMKLPSA